MYPHFPDVIDNTMRSAFVTCPRKFCYGYIKHLQPGDESIHLKFGKAYARGLEIARTAFFLEELSEEQAIDKGTQAALEEFEDARVPEYGSGANKSADRLVGALGYYFEKYPMSTDWLEPYVSPNHRLGVEFSFSVPIPGTVHPETGNLIMYAGTFDMLAWYNKQKTALLIEDDKTTSKLGDSWAEQWRLDSQITGYVWGVQQMGLSAVGGLIRGVSILKNKYGTAEAGPFQRPTWMLDRWLEQLKRDVNRMIESWKAGYWDITLDKSACASYGGCPYRVLCESPDPELWESDFIIRPWKPATHGR